MSTVNLRNIVECLIFVSEEPLTLSELCRVLDDSDREEIKTALAELREEYERDNRSFILAEVAGGYQFRTRSEFSGWVRRLIKERPARLSRPAMEVLAIVAYKQPLTRTTVDQMRGVDSSGVVKTLLDRRLVKIVARDEQLPGRPLLYGTTREFLEAFGLNSLADLPPISEVEALAEAGSQQLELIADERGDSFSPRTKALAPPPPERPELEDILPFEREDFSDEEHEAIDTELADIFKQVRRHHRQETDQLAAEAAEDPLEAAALPGATEPAPALTIVEDKPEEAPTGEKGKE